MQMGTECHTPGFVTECVNFNKKLKFLIVFIRKCNSYNYLESRKNVFLPLRPCPTTNNLNSFGLPKSTARKITCSAGLCARGGLPKWREQNICRAEVLCARRGLPHDICSAPSTWAGLRARRDLLNKLFSAPSTWAGRRNSGYSWWGMGAMVEIHFYVTLNNCNYYISV